MSEDGKFVYSFDEERYGSAEFDTREEAAAAAREEDEGTFFTGVVKTLRITDAATLLNLRWWWDTVEENFWEEVGEVGEIPRPSDEAFEELRKAIDEWATKHGLQPKFFRVDEVVTHHPDGSEEA